MRRKKTLCRYPPIRGLLAENCRQMRPNLASGVALALLGTVLAKETCDPFESFALQPATKGGHARPTATPAHVCNTLTPVYLTPEDTLEERDRTHARRTPRAEDRKGRRRV